MTRTKKVSLPDEAMPRQWYNLNADFPRPAPPPLHPGTGLPPSPDDLAAVFPMNLLEQEMSPHRWVDIPEPVLDVYRIWRPTPLIRAERLEKSLGCPVKIYYKYEGGSPAGSHKPNTAVAQAYFNHAFGVKRLVTETGAGQWGSALAFACGQFGLDCQVFMVRVSYDQKPYRRMMMSTWGADCRPSPSPLTAAGRQVLAADPDCPGSLGIAISEAVETALASPNSRYALGSVLNHVLLHQTVIGQEAKRQMAEMGEYPDVVVGCAGGGSNFAGLAFPYLADKIAGRDLQVVAAEPASCPTLTRGPYAYDFGDTQKMTPLLAMHTLGHVFMPAPLHAGGLRYHGMAPMVSHALELGLMEARSYDQIRTFEAGLLFARSEGFIPAPETNHAIAAVVELARQAKEEGRQRTILFNFSGHGLVDMAAYEAYLSGRLVPLELSDAEIKRALACLEGLPGVVRS